MKQYIIDEGTLLKLFSKAIELEYLDSIGVDNWSYYGEYREEYIQEELSCFLDEPISIEEINERDIDFYNVAKYHIKKFKEYKEN